jgi:hypothetical protein
LPYAFLKGRDERAVKNHGETLFELATSGGLDPVEIVCLLDDEPLPGLPVIKREGQRLIAQSVAELIKRLAAFRSSARNTPAADLFMAAVWVCPFCTADNVFRKPAGERAQCWMCKQWVEPVIRKDTGADDDGEEAGQSHRTGAAVG